MIIVKPLHIWSESNWIPHYRDQEFTLNPLVATKTPSGCEESNNSSAPVEHDISTRPSQTGTLGDKIGNQSQRKLL